MKLLPLATLIGLSVLAILRPAAAAPPTIDPRAVALLKQEAKAIQAIHAISVTCTVKVRSPHKLHPRLNTDTKIAVKLMRPDYEREIISNVGKSSITGKWSAESLTMAFMSDGNRVVTLAPGDSYAQQKARRNAVGSGPAMLLGGFFHKENSFLHIVKSDQKDGTLTALTYLGVKNWRGASCRVLQWRDNNADNSKDDPGKAPTRRTETIDLFIGADGLARHILQTNSDGWRIDMYLSNVTINPALSKSSFTIDLPKDAHLQKMLAAASPANAQPKPMN